MIEESNGIVISGKIRISLDGKRRDDLNVVSHAHSDHVGRINSAIATKETAMLAGIQDYRENYKLDDLEIRLVNAGHILGSSQVEILDGVHIAYTGDIRLRDSLLFKGADILNPEILVMESTFGMPHFSFPDYYEVYESIEKWATANLKAGRHVAIGSYALGKAQEITKLVNEMGEIPIVTEQIWENNNVYRELGKDIGDYLLAGTDEARELAKDPSIFIVPMNLSGWKSKEALRMSYGRSSTAGVVTGWATVFTFRSRGVDRAFPLSDHADFNDLVEYAESSGAKKIYVVHGYTNEFARELKRRGLDAEPL